MFCQEQVAQLRDAVPQIHAAGAELVILGNGSPDQAAWFVDTMGLTTPVFTDTDRAAYRLVGARRGPVALLNPIVFVSVLRATLKGYRQSATKGDATQLGGVFIVLPDGRVPYSYRSRHPADAPSPQTVLTQLNRVGR